MIDNTAKMSDATAKIKEGMAGIKLRYDYELANRIGVTRQSFSRKMSKPDTFSLNEIKAMARELNWGKEDLGDFIMKI